MRGRVLGAVIAGGQALRFGSDKALALVDGKPMIEQVLAALRPQVDDLVVCGRLWPGTSTLDDIREGRMGPLAGLESALCHAAAHGFASVLCVPVDTLPLPPDLGALLDGKRPAVLRHQHLIGHWPVDCRQALSHYLDTGERSLRGWITVTQARAVEEPIAIHNINTPADLMALD